MMNNVSAIETTGQDWANHLSHEISGNGMLYLVALLDEKLDVEVLKKATAELIELQPVLGCRFDAGNATPVWVPVDGEIYVREIHADSLSQGLDALTASKPQSRQLEVVLLTAPTQTALCLCFDHASTDCGGAKRCLTLLSRCYQRVWNGQAASERCSCNRADTQVYTHCGLSDYRLALKREAPISDSVTTVPYTEMDGHTVRYSWLSLPLSAVKQPDCTINDCLIAAYGVALSRVCAEHGTISIHMTVDLRRYLEEESAPLACNLSGMAAVNMAFDPNASYSSLLAEVKKQTALLKSAHIGLSSAALLTYLRTIPYDKARSALAEAAKKSRISGTAAPILSNLGRIVPDLIRFGNATVSNILPLLPTMHAPAFMLGACGYAGTLTLSAGTYLEERRDEDVRRLLRDIGELLREGYSR